MPATIITTEAFIRTKEGAPSGKLRMLFEGKGAQGNQKGMAKKLQVLTSSILVSRT